jgi:GDP-4-dehydro-6-deoxy-D-mannose reductase
MQIANILIGSNGFMGSQLLQIFEREKQFCLKIPRIELEIIPQISSDINAQINNDKFLSINLYHFGGTTEWIKIHEDPKVFMKRSIELAKHVIDLKSRLELPVRTVLASTGKVYSKSEIPLHEESEISPSNVLGETKLAIENFMESNISENENLIIGRIFNVYGPSQKDSFLVPTILKQIENENNKIELGNLTDIRDYLYVTDVVYALKTLAEQKIKPPKKEIFNVGSGVGLSPIEIANLLMDLLKAKKKIVSIKSRKRFDENPFEVANNSKLRSLGWKPKVNLDEGLSKCITKSVKQ